MVGKTPGENTPQAGRIPDAFTSNYCVIELPQSVHRAQDAARALGCGLGAVVKSLVFRGKRTGRAYLVATSGANRAVPALVEAALGEPVEIARPDFVLEQTGFPVGSVPPAGHSRRLETLIDADLLACKELWASAGTEKSMIRLTPEQLMEITSGKIVRLSNP